MTMSETASPHVNGQSAPATRPLRWSVHRELWENRFLYIAPVIVACIVLFGASVNLLMTLPKKMRALETLGAAAQQGSLAKAISMAPAPIMLATFIVGFFYCLDALYGERRDRSILFWKSLPVSDRTIVISKAAIPLVVLPTIGLVLGIAAQCILLLESTFVLLVNGLSPAPVWRELRFFEGLPIMVYGLSVHALWFAPIYGWLLLVSAWARRAPFLWAVLPFLGVAIVERMVFSTSHFTAMLKYRLGGAMKEAFAVERGGDIERLAQLDPLRFLSAPGLWLGLAFAAACLVAAMRLRRYREPI